VLFVSAPFIGDHALSRDNKDLHLAYGLQHVTYFIFFYLNYFYFIPKFLYKRDLKFYLVSVLTLMFAVYLLNILIDYQIMHLQRIKMITAGRIVPVIQVFAVSTVFKLLIDQIEIALNKKTLLEEKTKAELNYLRSQVNPHFLFNTLNNIAALIHIDADKAEKAVIKLSKIMRAMLGNEKNKKIPLEEELDLINSYIELQRMRLNEDTTLIYTTDGNTNSLFIEPLILINFVENVFKHGLGDEKSVIRIAIKIENNTLFLITENQITEGKKDETTGIGLNNVRKRLEIIYPEAHTLHLNTIDNNYKVELEMTLV
jgi:LytS/YehU family sensor histidine kinase